MVLISSPLDVTNSNLKHFCCPFTPHHGCTTISKVDSSTKKQGCRKNNWQYKRWNECDNWPINFAYVILIQTHMQHTTKLQHFVLSRWNFICGYLFPLNRVLDTEWKNALCDTRWRLLQYFELSSSYQTSYIELEWILATKYQWVKLVRLNRRHVNRATVAV